MRRIKGEDGFTLIEMLVVLLIITVLILLLLPNLTNRSSDVHEKGCKALTSTVQSQVYAYQLEAGKLPTSLDDLVQENYIESSQKKCSNNTPLQYNVSSGKVYVNE